MSRRLTKQPGHTHDGMPFPSTGCQTCKDRRVKCDETQPVCQRCAKSGRSCRGMTPVTSLSIHNENSYASGQKKRPRGPRSDLKKSSTMVMQPADPLLHRPLVDLNTKAIICFSHSHLQTPEGTLSVLKGVTNDLLPIWSSNSGNPVLELSVSSVALAVYARTQQQPKAALEASTRYHELLRLQQTVIASLHGFNIEACLIAIFFMARFEDVVYSPSYPKVQPSRKLQSFSHHDGALAILKYWKQHLAHIHPATDIIKYTRRGMIRSAILRSLDLPLWMLDGGSFGERGLELEYDCIAVRIVNMRYRLSQLLEARTATNCLSNEGISMLHDLREEAFDLDKTLQDWASFNLSTELNKRHDLSHMAKSLPKKYFYSPTVYSYSSPAQASVWILYYATRILVCGTLLRVLDLMVVRLGPAFNDERVGCLETLDKMASNLASSLPFSLQRTTVAHHQDAMFKSNSISVNANDDIKPYIANIMIWPLSLAANMGGVDIKYKTWFSSLLARLGRITGNALLESAETSSWPEL